MPECSGRALTRENRHEHRAEGDPPSDGGLGQDPGQPPFLHAHDGDAPRQAFRQPGRRERLSSVLRRREGSTGYRPHLLRLARADRDAGLALDLAYVAARGGRGRAGLLEGATGRARRSRRRVPAAGVSITLPSARTTRTTTRGPTS